jgi:hypothetical protein
MTNKLFIPALLAACVLLATGIHYGIHALKGVYYVTPTSEDSGIVTVQTPTRWVTMTPVEPLTQEDYQRDINMIWHIVKACPEEVPLGEVAIMLKAVFAHPGEIVRGHWHLEDVVGVL